MPEKGPVMSTNVSTEVANIGAVGSNRWYLSAAPIGRALLHLCVPMAAAMVVGAVYNVINSGFIGSQHNIEYLAAITLSTPLLGLIMGIGGMFGAGGGALISRLLGASENKQARANDIKTVASFAFWGSFILGAVFGGVGLLFLGPLVALLGATTEASPATSAYVAVVLGFVPVIAAAFCLEQLVRAEGAARQVMIGLIGSTIGNIIFDVLFILIFHWGVAGAALSMGLANVGVVLYFVVWLQRNSEHVSLLPRWFSLSPAVMRPVLGVGVGELLQSGFLIGTVLVLNHLAVIYGDGALAAVGVAVRIAQVPEFLIMGVTIGVLPLLAYSFGKGDRPRLMAALRGSAITVGGVLALSPRRCSFFVSSYSRCSRQTVQSLRSESSFSQRSLCPRFSTHSLVSSRHCFRRRAVQPPLL
jgi:multidrug efflux pump